MAIILFGSASTSPGEAQTATLSRTSLEDAVSLFSPGETYYNNAENWKAVICVMKSGRQQIRLKFGQNEDVTDFVTSLFVMLDQFEVVSVTLQDFDGGKFILPMTPEERTAMSMGVVPEAPAINPIFESTWTTTDVDQPVAFEVLADENFMIDWGEGAGYIEANPTGLSLVEHVYTTAGTYNINIDTTTIAEHEYKHLQMSISVSARLDSVESLGACGWTSFFETFRYAVNLKSCAGGDTSAVTDMRSMFNRTELMATLDVGTYDTTNVTDMSFMFYNTKLLTTLNVDNFVTTGVSNMEGMFSGMYAVESLNVSNFVTTGVSNMSSMFSNCKAVTSLDLSNFSTGSVSNMGWLFYGTLAMSALDLSGWDFSFPPSTSSMFALANFPLAITVNEEADKTFIDGLGYDPVAEVVVTVVP